MNLDDQAQQRRSPPQRMRRIAGRFRRSKDGTAAIEFGLLAFPFFLLIFATPLMRRPSPIPAGAGGHDISAAKPEISAEWTTSLVFLAFDCDSHNPPPCTGWVDDQIKPSAVAVPTRS